VRVVILPDAKSVAEFAAEQIALMVISKPAAVLGLATGSTPLGAYRRLIEMRQQRNFTFRDTTTFNLDEYVGLDPSHPASYRCFMDENLFQHLDLRIHQTFVPIGNAPNLMAECESYEKRIADAGGIDLQLLGIGTDGHIGFNEPGSSLSSRTRVKTLTEQTRRDNARFFNSLADVPTSAITMGIGSILQTRRVLLLATGAGKAEAVRSAVEGPLTASVPASALQLHADATIVVDDAAGSRLERMAYYRDSESERRRLGLNE
jgi:glucosamine-6-phosphate deaminase